MNPQKIIYSSKSWCDFEKKISNLQPKQRGTVFEWLCVFYLQIEPRYRTTYKRVLHSSEYLKENKIRRKLGLQNKEEGTDLIGETFDGKIDIIQCKYKDNNNKNISAKDINDPIRIASGREARKWVDTILICSNLKGFTKNKTIEELDLQFRTVSEGDFKKLTDCDFKNIRRIIDKKIPDYEKKSPRKHQLIAVEAIKKHFKKQKRGQMIHACGTGKTLTSYFLFRDMNPKLTLFSVPSLQLINQTLIEWTKESLANELPISPFVVCSDKSNEKIGECDPALWLHELGIKVSNKLEDLEKFIRSNRKRKVIFCTYQSGVVFSENMRKLNKKIDLGFFDEAHNTATSKRKLSSYLLFDKNIKIKNRLFMTATPKKFIGNNDEIASMEKDDIYGNVVDEITVKSAIEGIGGIKLLNDYKIITQIVKDKSYLDLLADNPFVVDRVRLTKEVELKLLSSAITLKKIRKDKNIKNVVSFHAKLERANAFRKGAKEIDKELNTYYVNGKQSGTERENILQDFTNNTPSLVTNAQCLSEGVNVPSIDAVMFVDPKQTRVGITQAIGRALRKGSKNKGDSFVIIPIVIDKDDPENIDEAYQQILMVLRAMSEHDGRIVEYFRLIRDGKKPPRNFVEINSEYSAQEFNLEDFNKKLHHKAWDRVAKIGRRPFEHAKEYLHPLCISSVSQYRKMHKNNEIPADIPANPHRSYRKEWTDWFDYLGNTSFDEILNIFIIEYRKYLADNPNNIFPSSQYVTSSNFKLGEYISSMKAKKNAGTLGKKYIKKINKEFPKIDFWEKVDNYNWKKRFKNFEEFYLKTNRTPTTNEIFEGKKVGNFFRECRQRFFSSNKKPLESWQLVLFKNLKVEFDENKNETLWKKNYSEYLEYASGKKKVKKMPTKLSRWAVKQRSNFKKKKLDKNKIYLLGKIPNWKWVIRKN